MRSQQIGVGLIGFGLAGAIFHAPLIRSVPRLALRGVASSRRDEVESAGLIVAQSDALMADDRIDLIVIASPNQTHYPLAKAALDAGKHVVVDKPFTTSVGEAEELIALARHRQRFLTVFHNRRWDGDFLTVKTLLDEERLGTMMLYQAHWDRFRLIIKKGWREEEAPGAGLLSDIGPHLIDQALLLFGWPEALTADLCTQRPQAKVDDYFSLVLEYGRMRVCLDASTMILAPRPRFEIHGTGGSFVKFAMDLQEARLRAGILPHESDFGADLPEHFGVLSLPTGETIALPTEPGNYSAFYAAVADAVEGKGPVPVDPEDAQNGLLLLEYARQSAREGRRLQV